MEWRMKKSIQKDSNTQLEEQGKHGLIENVLKRFNGTHIQCRRIIAGGIMPCKDLGLENGSLGTEQSNATQTIVVRGK